MTDWKHQKTISNISPDEVLPEISIPITLQRLVMEASANYDLSLIHHDKSAAKSVGAPDAFANSFFIMGMYERLIMEWGGLKTQLNKIGPLKMIKFNAVGDVVTFQGHISGVNKMESKVTLSLSSIAGGNTTTVAEAIVTLPQ